MSVDYQIEILDTSLNKIAEVLNPYPLDKSGMILKYSKELSDFGQCTFRVSAYDDMLTQYGDIIKPHQYHIRIRRNGAIVWQGAIINNSKRSKEFIEIVAAEYLFYLGKMLINRSSVNPTTGKSDHVYRIFKTGSMATAVTALINETIANYGSNHPLNGMTIGTIENPNFPPNMTDNTGGKLLGAWAFSTNLQLSYDFHTVLYVLKSFGYYSYADFYLDNSLVFNFKKFVGNDRHYDVSFIFNQQNEQSNSNIIDYNLPRFGQRMVNKLTGIATNTQGVILHKDQSDQTSISTYGLLEGVAAYIDVKDQGILNARTQAELPLVATPDETNAIFILNETAAYPLGLWNIGDIITCSVKNKAVDFSDTRRVVGVTVQVHNTGRETTTVQTNKPLPFQLKSATAA